MMFNTTRRLENSRGYTLVELLVAVSIFGVIALAGLPHVDRRREDINTAVQRVVADMRYARSRAITSGEHYALSWTSGNEYEVQRLELDGAGIWKVSSVERTVILPLHIDFSLGEATLAEDRFEFNTRGMMVASPQPIWPVISDVVNDVDHIFSVWPSGQIYLEE